MNDAANAKNALRSELRQRIRTRSADENARASEKITRNALDFVKHSYAEVKRVAIFLATVREPNLDALALHYQQSGVLLYAPQSQNSAQQFALIVSDWSNVSINARGWREPNAFSDGDLCAATEMDLIFVPALAFDETGARLGQGGGWYDRALADLPAAIPIIGVAFDFQIVDCVPREAHDHSVSTIITDKRVITSRVIETA